MWVFPRAEEVTNDIAAKTQAMPRPLAAALAVSAVLLVLGIIGFVVRAGGDGFDELGPWGYYAAIFSFIFMVTSTAPLAAVGFRFTKSHWRRPLSRVAELFSIVGILNLLMFIPLMFLLPGIANPDAVIEGELAVRRTIWFEGPIGAPHAWDLVGVAFLTITSLTILWISAKPDMAECRDTATGFRRWLYN